MIFTICDLSVMENASFDFTVKFPSSCSILGPSQSGKSTLIFEIIKNRDKIYNGKVTNVVYVYYKLNEKLLQLCEEDDKVILVESIQEADKHIQSGTLLILDDMLEKLRDKQTHALVSDYFYNKVHHYNFALIVTLQRGFYGEITKGLLDNSQMLIYFDFPRYRSLITHVAKNFSPGNIRYVQEAYRIATSKPHGYLLFDFATTTPNDYRLRNKIYPTDDDETLIFTAL